MLYCPKCQQKYEDGTQRFCADDQTRLVPTLASGNSFNQTGGVFANILSRAASVETEDKFSTDAAERQSSRTRQPAFRPPAGKMFKDEREVAAEIKNNPPPLRKPIEKSLLTPSEKIIEKPPAKAVVKPVENLVETPIEKPIETSVEKPFEKTIQSVQKPLPRSIDPSEIPRSQAALGDRKTNPLGRPALTRKNTDVLSGQMVKSRYLIGEKIGDDVASVDFLAEDKIVGGKKVLVRVLMDEEADNYFTNKTFAEQRVSLSHLNHPNVESFIDSGALPEGKPFIVTEYVEGTSVKEMLGRNGQFNALRAARIVRQASDALSEAHQNGILHRRLSAENIILTVSENGAETIKLTNFGVSKGKSNRENVVYRAPEQIEGKPPTIAADVYALAVVAYQMLTNRQPFDASSVASLLKSQREGLAIAPTSLRADVPPVVDEILKKGLAFDASTRYPKARDFGDALFNAITTGALFETESVAAEIKINAEKPEIESASEPKIILPESALPPPPETEKAFAATAVSTTLLRENEKNAEADRVETTNAASERRLPEASPKAGKKSRALPVLLGALAVLITALGLGYLAYNRSSEQTAVTPPVVKPSEQATDAAAPEQPAPPVVDKIVEAPPPPPRALQPPPDTVRFENSKQALKADAAKNFLGFSLYYPKDWQRNDAKNNFLDVSKNARTGTPIEQMLVSHYDSKGTFEADKEIFPALVKETNSTLKSFVPNYKLISEGEKTVNNGWRAYEVKFAGAGKTAKGEDIKLWGKRLFIPAARAGMKNGYVLTMLATSLSPEVKSIEDVGVKGDLQAVLYSFEPNQNF